MFWKQANYAKRFRDALSLTQRVGLSAPEVSVDDARLLASPEARARLGELIGDLIGEIPVELIAGQCAAITEALVEPVEDTFQTAAHFTVGWVRDGHREAFRMSEADIRGWLKGNTRGNLSIHCWLTLPTMELIDCTFFTSISVATNRPELLGQIVVGHAEDVPFEYQPMVVGTELLYRAGWIANGMFGLLTP